MGRQPASTKIGQKRVHVVRVRGGNFKCRALRLDSGNFSWGSEAVTRKTRVLDVVYNATNNELVRTKTLVKGSIIQVDAAPFRQWWESHYSKVMGAASSEEADPKKSSKKDSTVDPLVEEQMASGRLYAIIKSRPGQSGRCDGYILEGKELEFYVKKIKAKK
jgi:small subunit ribosomal protein S8e